MLDRTIHNTHEDGGDEALNCTTDCVRYTHHDKHCNNSAEECRCKVSTAMYVS